MEPQQKLKSSTPKSKNILIILIKYQKQPSPPFPMIQQPQPHLTQEDHPENWQQKCRSLTEKLSNLEHEKKKIDIELRNDLEFQRKRANQFQEKYKNAIRYKNQEEELKKILGQLNQALTTKENQILEYIKVDQEKKRKIAELDNLNEQLTRANEEIKDQLAQIQQGAISAILQKDNIISQLEERVAQLDNIDTNSFQATIADQEQKIKQLEDQLTAEKHETQSMIEMKDEQLREIRDKFDIQRERYEEKITLLEQEIISYEKHIEKINEQRNHEENLQQKYYLLQEKQRKTEKKLQEFELAYKTQKQDLIDAIQKMEGELTAKGEVAEELKSTQNKLKQLEKEIKSKKKEIEESKNSLEKTKTEYTKKISNLEQEKKKVQESLDLKSGQLERIRLQSEQNHSKIEIKTPQKKSQKTAQKDGSSLAIELETMPNIRNSSRRESSQQNSLLIQKLRAQIKALQQNIEQLNKKLEQEMKQAQKLRKDLLEGAGSAGRSDGQARLLVQIEDLNSYIKKVQHNLMITKLKYAEDESHWTSRESQLKKQLQKQDRKSKKQKAELIQRIDRMKKTNTKDKKTDYYQSSLK